MDFDPHAILTRLRGGSNASSTTPAAQKASNPVSGTPYQSYSNSRDYSTSQSASKTKTDKKKKGKELIPTHLHATRTAIGTPGIVNSSNSSPKASSIVSNMRDTYNSNGNSADANSLGSGKTGSSRHSLTHYDTTNEVTALEIRTDLERALQEIKNENADLKAQVSSLLHFTVVQVHHCLYVYSLPCPFTPSPCCYLYLHYQILLYLCQLKALTREHKSLNDDYEAYKSKMGETTSKLRGQIVDQNRQLNEMRILAHPNRYTHPFIILLLSSTIIPVCCNARVYSLFMPCDDDDDDDDAEYTNLCNLCFLLFLFIYSPPFQLPPSCSFLHYLTIHYHHSPATKAIRTVNGKAIAKGLKYDPNAVPPPPTVYQERALSEALHRADASSHRSFTKPTFSELMRRSGSSTDEHGTPANIR